MCGGVIIYECTSGRTRHRPRVMPSCGQDSGGTSNEAAGHDTAITGTHWHARRCCYAAVSTNPGPSCLQLCTIPIPGQGMLF